MIYCRYIMKIMYKKNDIVTYGQQGVCKITAITEKSFEGELHQYYELVPVYDIKSTFFVPVANSALTEKMHSILSADEINGLIKSMPSENPEWISDETLRKTNYKTVLGSGDRRAIMCTLKALHRHKSLLAESGKKMHICDEHFIKDAERVIYDEFAFVLDIDRSKVEEHIEAVLNT